MHAMWVSLKENVNCGSSRRWTDVVRRPEKISMDKRCIFKKENPNGEIGHRKEEQVREVIFRQNPPRNWYCELTMGDPSRNIVETIVQAASAYPSKHCRKTKKVLRVNNSVVMVEGFEKYREMVKKRACERHKRHLRSEVDGNELLQFYGTTMNCCSGKPSKALSKACKDQTCRVCRIIESGFNTAYLKKNGIRLSTSSKELSENFINIAEVRNVKRAVIVCRTIAGIVGNVGDERSREDYDSFKIEGLYSKSEYLVVQNPSAVLPCFVVVLKNLN